MYDVTLVKKNIFLKSYIIKYMLMNCDSFLYKKEVIVFVLFIILINLLCFDSIEIVI